MDGTIKSNGSGDDPTDIYGIMNTEKGTLEINGGTIIANTKKADAHGIYNYRGGKVIINGRYNKWN